MVDRMLVPRMAQRPIGGPIVGGGCYKFPYYFEATFATLRHRTVAVKGAFSKETAVAMLFQLALEAEKSWRRITGSERLAEVISGVVFVDGKAQTLAS
ncbi:hypothetical protein [Ferrimicrobium sp.]|uniref:hypothetical protein n=1 Tax=Ferrimicrobium sp. TaxID=2926050 RepID=UPI00262D8355|nr:hypothetical protein [Ferrimicrobium sp.]